MRTLEFLKSYVVITLLFVIIGSTAIGQCTGHERFQDDRGLHRGGLNLSDEQQEQMKTFRLELMKEMTPIKNEIKVKTAELNMVSTGDNVDTKKVNSLLDEIGSLKTKMAKKKFAHKQKVRGILTDEQKVLFDAHAGKMFGNKAKRGDGQMMKHRMHKGKRPVVKSAPDQYDKKECPIKEKTEILG